MRSDYGRGSGAEFVMMRLAVSAALVLGISACGGGGGGGSDGRTPGNGGVIVRFEDQVRALDAAAARMADLDFSGTLPGSGSAVYRGHLGATAVVDGAAPDFVVAEVEMTALFASGTIGGTFRNLASSRGDVSGGGVFDGGRFGPSGIESPMAGTLSRGGAAHAIDGAFRGAFLGEGARGLGGGMEATLSRDGASTGRLDGELWAEN